MEREQSGLVHDLKKACNQLEQFIRKANRMFIVSDIGEGHIWSTLHSAGLLIEGRMLMHWKLFRECLERNCR